MKTHIPDAWKDKQCVKGWTIEIKSCVLHNLFKANFAPHTFIVVLWDSWTSASQDKMIKQHEEEALKVVLYELLNASFSLFDTNEWTKISLGEFSLKSLFIYLFLSWMNDNETVRNLKLKYCFRDNCCAQTLTQ